MGHAAYGAIATYRVSVAARPNTGDTLVLSNPDPFTDYPGMVWPNNLLFEQTSVAFPYLMGYEGAAPEEAAEESDASAHKKKKKRSKHRSHSPSPSPSDDSSSSSSSNASRRRKAKRHRSKSKHGGHKHSKRHKHRRHSSSPGPDGDPPHDSNSSSGSGSDDNGTTIFKDAGNRPVTRVRGTSMQTIRTSEPLRAFATPARIESLL
jgi:hypothetical protein